MTDKEIEKVWAKYHQKEDPASEPIDFEKELYKAFGQVKDFTLGMRIAKWFYDMGKNSQEPVSGDLESLANDIGVKEEIKIKIDDLGTEIYVGMALKEAVKRAVKVGANWQKQQMKKNTIRGIAHLDVDHSPYEIVIKAEEIQNLKHGTLVKFIIIK